ncbi:MAG: hypothetical protein ACLU9T_18350 [Blautia faecis]
MEQYARSVTYFDRQNPDIEEAKKFLVKWQKQLTRKLNKEDKILSLKSRDLRKKEIEDLRKKKVKVNGFDSLESCLRISWKRI